MLKSGLPALTHRVWDLHFIYLKLSCKVCLYFSLKLNGIRAAGWNEATLLLIVWQRKKSSSLESTQQHIPSIDKLTSNQVPTATIYRHCKELQCRQRTLIKLWAESCREAIIWRDWGQWLKGQQNSHKSHSISLASRLDLRVKIECRIFTLQTHFHLALECEGSKFQALKL